MNGKKWRAFSFRMFSYSIALVKSCWNEDICMFTLHGNTFLMNLQSKNIFLLSPSHNHNLWAYIISQHFASSFLLIQLQVKNIFSQLWWMNNFRFCTNMNTPRWGEKSISENLSSLCFFSLKCSLVVYSFRMTACLLQVLLCQVTFLGLCGTGTMGRPVCLAHLLSACPRSRLWVLDTNTWNHCKKFHLLCWDPSSKKVTW